MLGQRRADEAVTAAQALAGLRPESAEPLLLLGRARQQQGRFDDMLALARKALATDPAHRGAQLQFAEASIFCGQHHVALQQLEQLESAAANDPLLLQHIAEYYAHMGKHEQAHRCYLRAAEKEPDSPRFLYNLASSQVAIGELSAAEATFTRVIELNPDDYDAWQNRSNLARQTSTENHIDELIDRLENLRPGAAGEVPLCYALAKEYEDLGEFARSFEFLRRGANSRRQRMAYDVGNDVAILKRIAELFAEPQGPQPGSQRSGPIFIMGLPRSGTTLVDRIVSSHSRVESMGEINDFALTLTRLGKASDKNKLLQASLAIDPKMLGDTYIESVTSYGLGADFFIDKTPANYLYVGLLQRALPKAPMIHLTRHPIDSCLAMYRTLFRMGYPFSYDLNDLADYYIAYHGLIEHWRQLYPDTLLGVSYEELVDDQLGVSQRIIEHCGLQWEPACLEFDSNAAPVATASAAQVRKPIYRDALARWRNYETELQPLIQRLEAAGIAL